MRRFLSITVLFMLLLHLSSCDDLEIMSPPGPSGLSAYQAWVKAVESGEIKWTAAVDLANFFKYLKGEQGEPGSNAFDVWKELIKTGTVDNPHKPGSKWDPAKNSQVDFYYFLSGAKGDAGITPHINAAGNWQIGDKDTGIAAAGIDGQSGLPGQPGAPGPDGNDGDKVKIGLNGNWEINGLDSGIPAVPKDGVQGSDGKSAFEIWNAEVAAGLIKDKEGTVWPTGNNSLADFWYYLSGGLVMQKETTPLKFINSLQDPDDFTHDIFEFETDPGAVVTMRYGDVLATGTADVAGKCFVRFTNNEKKDRPVLATALKAGKNESASLLLVVRTTVPLFKLPEKLIWLDEDGKEMDTPNGEYRPFDEIPYIYLKADFDEKYKVIVPIEFGNVKEAIFMHWDIENFNFSFEWNNPEKTKATVTFWANEYDYGINNESNFIFQIIGLNDAVSFKQIKVKVAP